ncbi:iron complex transport system ATP-binding protein [Amaricoccus macauensis]|uniref:Iron complex transport system ATP-binding protein n=1 Tax=Amaricoccus macauensis TaxID=57001 RepID=A0A840SR91_9RHOB|nr:ABC transporter ATP-binding protein [Amaricoccus macauensis]MBB5223085.1 iron complex transport system ATP-binding protein [Amaricoccus macauensis]
MTLAVLDLCFSYGPGGRRLEGISFSAGARDVVCILGPNGSGKTTLLRCLIGGLAIASGRITLAGQDATRLPPRRLARLVAYVPQGTQSVFGHRVLDIVMMGRSAHLRHFQTPGPRDEEIAVAALERVGIAGLAERSFSTISGGERQLCLLARAVAQKPAVLILDEPAASLDFANQARILDILAGLADGGLAVVMTTHHPDHALQIGTQVLGLRDGRVIADGPASRVLDEGFLTGLYGTPIRVIRSPDGLAACRPCPSHASTGVF